MKSNKMTMTDVQPIKPPAPYVGGKSKLAKRLISMINGIEHTTYAEPFIGMGGVFLRRNQKPTAEVINDLSGDISTFFRILQRHYVAFLDMLRFQLTTRAEFERLRRVDPTTLTDLERAARFLYMQSLTYGGLRDGVMSVQSQRAGRFDVSRLQPLLEDLHLRLGGVVIERLHFDDFIRRYDHDRALFFIDSPYHGIEDLYGKDLFSRDDFTVLVDRLKVLKGNFILTINDKPETRQLFSAFQIQPVTFRYTVSHTDGKELIVSNRPIAANDDFASAIAV